MGVDQDHSALMPANFTTGGFAFLCLSLVCQHSPTPATATAAAVPGS